MGMAMPSILMLQLGGVAKPSLGQVQRADKPSCGPSVNSDSLCIKSPLSLSPPNVYGLRTVPYGALSTEIRETN